MWINHVHLTGLIGSCLPFGGLSSCGAGGDMIAYYVNKHDLEKKILRSQDRHIHGKKIWGKVQSSSECMSTG